MNFDNEMSLSFSSKSVNESFARVAISAFLAPLDPMISELTDIKTSVSEAVTNAIIHAYGDENGIVYINCKIVDRDIYIEVIDRGVGIKNIQEALTPLYTSKPEMERSGMGFTVMESFMDDIKVESNSLCGTIIKMKKTLAKN